MASIADTADKAIKAGHWYSTESHELRRGVAVTRRYVMHYSTVMLSFNVDDDGEWDGNMDTVDYSTGHGSVTDQQGMNKLFARLAMPLYFRRAGGAEVIALSTPNYKYGITPQARYDRQMARMFRSVSVEEVLNTWPIKTVEV